MRRVIHLHVSHPRRPPGRIVGFSFLWAYFISGFDPEYRCQRCFRGELARNFYTHNAHSGVDILLDRIDDYPFVYVCGVAAGAREDRWRKNLHLPLRYETGAVARATSYNGYQFVALNAVELPIPPLPDGWRGLPIEHTRCKNFRFAVEYLGATGPRPAV